MRQIVVRNGHQDNLLRIALPAGPRTSMLRHPRRPSSHPAAQLPVATCPVVQACNHYTDPTYPGAPANTHLAILQCITSPLTIRDGDGIPGRERARRTRIRTYSPSPSESRTRTPMTNSAGLRRARVHSAGRRRAHAWSGPCDPAIRAGSEGSPDPLCQVPAGARSQHISIAPQLAGNPRVSEDNEVDGI